MDRCAKAFELHKQGYNCAQSVAGAFADLLDLPMDTLMAVAGGFGGGVGGSHEEVCGAISGGVMVLSLLHPHTDGADRAGKVHTYALAKEFRRRYEEVFGLTRCGDLLRARPGVTDKNPAAQRLGVTAHCDNMVVTATEILEKMLEEEKAEQ
ncbi:C-GCAxxG-C-C family protein [uncultured Oscillibacter sp.]|uniref:C-GCAxxG-C-C family protein n=1 Tax=uncultured Oscillibacter sp. TaxID=876091 RepID=UPI0025F866A5|nr:C-GCAxxG-C-C family protein [uncultured Oscillibacter sp.]